jgi:hypothetical protein
MLAGFVDSRYAGVWFRSHAGRQPERRACEAAQMVARTVGERLPAERPDDRREIAEVLVGIGVRPAGRRVGAETENNGRDGPLRVGRS